MRKRFKESTTPASLTLGHTSFKRRGELKYYISGTGSLVFLFYISKQETF
jgi:hypothetical protein